MKTHNEVFTYVKKDGSSSIRDVLIMNDCGVYVQGFDMKELSKKERKTLKGALKNRDIRDRYATAYNPANPIQGIDNDLMKRCIKKAWKTFKTEGIFPVEAKGEVLTKEQVWDFLQSKGFGTNLKSVQRNLNKYLQKPYKNGLYGKYVVTPEKGSFSITTK